MRKIKINYKSGRSTEVNTNLTAEEIAKRLTEKHIDIDPSTLAVIVWSEVESISST